MNVPPPNTRRSRSTLAALLTIRESSLTASFTSSASSAERTRRPPCTPPLSAQYKSHSSRPSIMRLDISSPSASDPISAVDSWSRLSARAGKKNNGTTGSTAPGRASRPSLAPGAIGKHGAPRGVGGAKMVTVATDCGSPSWLVVRRRRFAGRGSGRPRAGWRVLDAAGALGGGARGKARALRIGAGGRAEDGAGDRAWREARGREHCTPPRHWPLHA